MKMFFVLTLVVAPAFLGCKKHSGAESTRVDAAVSVAEAWLQCIDKEQYDQSWDNAAGALKMAVGKPEWCRMLQGVRRPLGKVNSRFVKSKEFTRSLPGAPDGEYVVIRFETSFENKRSAVETVTPAFDKDSTWRVSGYFIK